MYRILDGSSKGKWFQCALHSSEYFIGSNVGAGSQEEFMKLLGPLDPGMAIRVHVKPSNPNIAFVCDKVMPWDYMGLWIGGVPAVIGMIFLIVRKLRTLMP